MKAYIKPITEVVILDEQQTLLSTSFNADPTSEETTTIVASKRQGYDDWEDEEWEEGE